MPAKSEMLINAALEAVTRVREDLALGEAQLRRAKRGPNRGDALAAAHQYLHTAAEAARTAAQTALHAGGEAGRESLNARPADLH